MLFDRDTPSVVFYGNCIVLEYGYSYSRTVSGKSFIYAIVDNFPYEMMQPFYRGIPYVHGRPFPYSLQTIENLYLLRTVAVVFSHTYFHLY